MAIAKKILSILNPVADKEKDGRDVWPNRAAFILAAMVSLSLIPSVAYLSPLENMAKGYFKI